MVLARWQRTIVDDFGTVLPGAQVTVRREVAGAPLASLFSDRDGLVSTGNPITADSSGLAAFYVEGGAYRITAALGGFTTTWRYVGIGTASEADIGDVPALVQEVDAGYALLFETGTSAPPSAGAIRFNNANLASATSAFVSGVNLAGSSIEARLLELFSAGRTVKDTFMISNPASGEQASFQIANAVDSGAYVTLTVGAHAGATTFPAGERINFQPNRAGADGADGSVVGVRERLTGNRTYYVRSDGNDANNGLVDSAGGAFLTVQKAADIAYDTLDLAGFNVDIQIRDGTFARCVVMTPQVGTGSITLRGNSGTPANVTLTATAIGEPAGVVEVRNFAVLFIRDFTLTCATSGSAVQARDGGVVYIAGGIRFGACAHYHMHAASNAFIKATANYSIVGAATVHIRPGSLSEIRHDAITVTITGTPAFSTAFVQAYFNGVASLGGVTWSGSATGARFHAIVNASISVNGGINDLPGNAAGFVESGAVYVGLVDYATAAEIRTAAAGAGKKVMTAELLESAAAFVGGAVGTIDWDAGVNRFLTMTADAALGNPSNNQVGTWRTFWIVGNDATPRTLTFSGNWVGNITAISGITSTQRVLIHVFALDSTFAWVSPPSGKF